MTDDNQVWFWGGYFYQEYHKYCIEGFNLLNEEKGIPQGKNIAEFGMGFSHDTVMVDEEEPMDVMDPRREIFKPSPS